MRGHEMVSKFLLNGCLSTDILAGAHFIAIIDSKEYIIMFAI